MDTALGLSLWSQSTGHRRRRDPTNPAPLEPSLTLSLSDIDACRPSLPAKNEASAVSSFSTADHDHPSPAVVKRESEEGERVSSRGSGDEDEEGGAAASSRKKLRLTKEQSALLEDRFKEHSTLNPKQKQALAMQLNLRPRQVEVWFQNRRARTKLKQTEVDCEVLKRCCETLTDENRRLQKELQELRAIKLSPPPPPPPLYVQFPAAGAAITVCPSCGGTSKAGSPFAAAPSKPQFFSPFTHSSAAC